jgi:hypothetical protein
MAHRVWIASFAFLSKRVLRRSLIATLLVAASAAHGQGAPATPQKPQAAAISAAKQPSGAVPAATTAGVPAPGVAPRALREAMAELLEKSIGYRSTMQPAPRLHDAKFIGPLLVGGLFRSPEAIYCASAKIDFWPIPAKSVALLRVVTDENGKQRIVASVGITGGPLVCRDIKNYGPFPELEAARERRRQALGVKD